MEIREKGVNRETAIEKNKIRLYYYLGSILSILLLVVLLSFTYSRSLDRECHRKIAQLSSGIINEKKRFLRNAVDRTLFMIQAERSHVEDDFSGQNLTQAQKDEISKTRVSRRIRDLRLIDNGYVWVNRIVDYAGGEKYARRQVHPNLPDTEGEWLSTHSRDIKGNQPYLTELEGVKKDGEIYFEYYFKRMDSDEISHKMSYAKLYKPWDWVVATGVYLDDVDRLVRAETQKMEATLKTQQVYAFSIAALACLVSAAVLVRFEKRISRLIRSYEQDTRDYTASLIAEKEKTETAMAEIKQLKGLLPICSHCKKIRDDKGYWNFLESYIETHSQASFSHSMCPSCSDELYGSQAWYIKMKNKKNGK